MTLKVTRLIRIGFMSFIALVLGVASLTFYYVFKMIEVTEEIDFHQEKVIELERYKREFELITNNVTDSNLKQFKILKNENISQELSILINKFYALNYIRKDFTDMKKSDVVLLARLNHQTINLNHYTSEGKIYLSDLNDIEYKSLVFHIKDSRNILQTFINAQSDLITKYSEKKNNYIVIINIIIIFFSLLIIGLIMFMYSKLISELDSVADLQQKLKSKEIEISKRIQAIQAVIEKISNGQYNIKVSGKYAKTIGSVSAAINKMAEHLNLSFNKITENEWLQTGIARLNKITVGDKSLKILSTEILDYCLSYTNSVAACIYIKKGDQLILQDKLGINKGIEKVIELGQGLVGTAIKKREITVLRDINQTLITISYLAGEAKPKNIILIPLIDKDESIGIIELLTLNDTNENTLQLLNTIKSYIAIALKSAINYSKLQDLYEETQSQSEELLSQHEELKSLNSKLETRSQMLQESEENLRNQQHELQQSYHQLEVRNRTIILRNNEIKAKAIELERITNYKSDFLANMSHELRTPLNSILLLSKHLSEEVHDMDSNDLTKAIAIINDSGNSLLTLINEILDLSKIEAGQVSITNNKVDVHVLIHYLVRQLKPMADEKHLKIQLNLPKGIRIVQTDQQKLEQILRNIIFNAIKFTETGHIAIEVKSENNQFIVFEISDTGIGIENEHIPTIFEAFKQADSSTSKKYGGTGLGLSISKNYAILLGGNITAKSEFGKGSTFELKIPFKQNSIVTNDAGNSKASVFMREPSDVVTLNHYKTTEIFNKNLALIIGKDVESIQMLTNFVTNVGYSVILGKDIEEIIQITNESLTKVILIDPYKEESKIVESLKTLYTNNPSFQHPIFILTNQKSIYVNINKNILTIPKPVNFERLGNFLKITLQKEHINLNKIILITDNTQNTEHFFNTLSNLKYPTKIYHNTDDIINELHFNTINCYILYLTQNNKLLQELKKIHNHPASFAIPSLLFSSKTLTIEEDIQLGQYVNTIIFNKGPAFERALEEISNYLSHASTHQEQKSYLQDEKDNIKDSLENKTALIVDDDPRNLFALTQILEKLSIKVITAHDGKKALEILKQNDQISIILLDILMPELNGFDTITEIKSKKEWEHVPIIAVTAKSNKEVRQKCIALGASDYITKPIDVKQLTALLKIWLFKPLYIDQ